MLWIKFIMYLSWSVCIVFCDWILCPMFFSTKEDTSILVIVNGLYLYSTFLVFWPLKVLLHYKWPPHRVLTCSSGRNEHPHTYSYTVGTSIWSNSKFSILLKDMRTGGAWSQTTNLLISGRPTPPSESQPLHFDSKCTATLAIIQIEYVTTETNFN